MRKTYEFKVALSDMEILKEPVWVLNIELKFDKELVMLPFDHLKVALRNDFLGNLSNLHNL
jgi:hypothetical protein